MVWVLLLVGCTAEAPEDTGGADTDDAGACGDVTTWDVEVRAAVQDAGGSPVAGATVALEDRAWSPGTLGAGATDAQGVAVFAAAGVTSVEGCWGTMLDYWLVADDGAGGTAEDDMNTELFNAIDGGSLVADVTGRPLVIE